MVLVLVVVVVALAFEYVNGFHDTANSIAAAVSTKALTPAQAVVLAAFANLLGALWGTQVALTITLGLVDSSVVVMTSSLLLCALIGAIIWNLITWWFGLPASSSHALIGGLCGAALAASHGNWHAIIWSQPKAEHWWLGKGLLWKVVLPMLLSPLAGFVIGLLFMAALYITLQRCHPSRINGIFAKVQILSSASMGFMHGTNDAQKTMGVIALVLLGATRLGELDNLPWWLQFLHTPEPAPGKPMTIAVWIKIVCALAMAAGTAAGGWRIIGTLGRKVVKMQPIHGFAAQVSSSVVIAAASMQGIPLSTTHNVSASIMGVGAAKRLSAVNFVVVERMLWAWIFTTPVAGLLAYFLVRLSQVAGWIP